MKKLIAIVCRMDGQEVLTSFQRQKKIVPKTNIVLVYMTTNVMVKDLLKSATEQSSSLHMQALKELAHIRRKRQRGVKIVSLSFLTNSFLSINYQNL